MDYESNKSIKLYIYDAENVILNGILHLYLIGIRNTHTDTAIRNLLQHIRIQKTA